MGILDPIGFCLAEVCDLTFHSAGLVLSVKLRPDQCAAIIWLQTGKLEVAQLFSEQKPLLERSSPRHPTNWFLGCEKFFYFSTLIVFWPCLIIPLVSWHTVARSDNLE